VQQEVHFIFSSVVVGTERLGDIDVEPEP
jgi:hypothetical protein